MEKTMANDPDKTRATSRIPFNRARPAGREMTYVAEAVASGHVSGDGAYTVRCQELLQDVLGTGRTLLTTSGTHALELAALLLDIKPGDEVIIPSFTFPSTANAFVLRGARLVFCDIEPRTLNLDLSVVEDLMTPRTRAIVPIHYGGIACNMNILGDICARHDVAVIEDNAHGLFGQFEDSWLGTLGVLGTLSFHESKNITCGEGGALLINDASLLERAEIIREKGTDRSRFFRGEVDRYTWRDVGSSYLPAEILAAYLYGQLENWQDIQAARQRVFDTYERLLRPVAGDLHLGLPTVPPECRPAYHMYYVLAPSATLRDRLLEGLSERGVHAVSHYQPLHSSAAGQRYGSAPRGCPVTTDISARILRLPFYATLAGAAQREVVRALYDSLQT